ncbi:type I 3-dehydroquinate dehydratase [Oscillospiraceae bacterium OttesenSCG-928-G22]|nr:type I 3-dehydroquinate dehydratase [Oscillospiraceae bacterium OttesenSCG-928-G22]
METVRIRNLEIGRGRPKLCLPITGKTDEDILRGAESCRAHGAEIVEWRADYFDGALDKEAVSETLASLRGALGGLPLLVTFRSAAEGGARDIPPPLYRTLVELAARSPLCDLVDVEFSAGAGTVAEVIRAIRARGGACIISSHDMKKTPPKEALVSRLLAMRATGADILKIAVMAREKADALTLLAASLEMSERHAKGPIIALSMGAAGRVSRVLGEVFGSSVTFAMAEEASAPGQMAARDVAPALDMIHRLLRDDAP